MLALVAGRGALPGQVAAAQNETPLVCVVDGYAPDNLVADITFRLETLGTLLETLEKRGVTDVCFCGGIDRLTFNPTALDAKTMPLVPLFKEALQAGDDGAMRAAMTLFEKNGFTIRAAHDLVPELVALPGVLSKNWPDAQMRADAARGTAVLAALAPLDVGQACVVGGGQVLGIEGLGGTDFLLKTLPETPLRSQAVLVKGPKLGQDTRTDLPTIGPRTVQSVISAGLAGIVIDAGDVIMLEPDEVKRTCDDAGLILWSREGD
ncbi:MAG: UDP-2,3-diacylglucosamine diphosphatase LpxI [Paracoccaceae bacterium]